MCTIFIKPVQELTLLSHELLELIKSLYAVFQVIDYWNHTITEHLKVNLDMSETSVGCALYLKKLEKELKNLIENYFNDSFMADKDNSFKRTKETLETFLISDQEDEIFKISKMSIRTN